MASRPSARSHAVDDTPGDLNLVPVMGIMTILIPILLFMFTFNEVTVQRVQAPRSAANAAATPGSNDKERELNLTVLVRRDKGFQLTWEDALMGDSQTAELIPTIKAEAVNCPDPSEPDKPYEQGCALRADGCHCYDFPSLYTQLMLKKRQFSKPEAPEEKLNIAADSNVKWEVISRVIDAAECIRERDSYGNFDEWKVSKRKKGETLKVPGSDDPVIFCERLFPKVVFALVE